MVQKIIQGSVGIDFFLEKGFGEAFLNEPTLNRKHIRKSQVSLMVDIPNSISILVFKSHFQIFSAS